jgi:DNA-directed RNA polymerase subunit L
MDLKVLEYDKTNMESRLELNLKGKDINHILVNTIRRAAMSYVPIYAWDVEINKNTSIYNNSIMKLRLQNLPIINIKNDNIYYTKEKEEIKEDNFIEDMELSVDTETKINIDMNNLVMYLNYTNNDINNVNITTDDCIFYNNEGKKIKSIYTKPIPIIILQPKQTITLSCKLKLGIESMSAIYSPVSIFSYKENKENDYNLFIESRGQISEKDILLRTIMNLKKELEKLNNIIPDVNIKKGSLMIQDIDHTIGNIVAYYCFHHKDVEMFSYNMPHILNKVVKFNYSIKNNSVKNIINSSINNINKDLDILLKKVKTI